MTVGEDKVIKIYPIKTLRELKRCEFFEVGTVSALYVDSKYVYAGGNKVLLIWDSSSAPIVKKTI